eukprot:1637175-Rhodomonas_salina.1
MHLSALTAIPSGRHGAGSKGSVGSEEEGCSCRSPGSSIRGYRTGRQYEASVTTYSASVPGTVGCVSTGERIAAA